MNRIAILALLASVSAPQGLDPAPPSLPVPCQTVIEDRIVRGRSLDPLIREGQRITLLRGYYLCHPVRRGDVVAYGYAGNPDPLLKIVRAAPGDRFSLRRVQAGQGPGWHVIVNGTIAKNSQGLPYLIDARGHRMLSLYARSYGGAVPEGACLILGNQPGGSLDSTRFGLVSVAELLGKVALD